MLAMIMAFISCEDLPVAVTGLTLDVSSLSLVEGNQATLTATVSPEDAANKNVAWSSSDVAVATVEGGKVKALKAGTAKITATTDDGGLVASQYGYVEGKHDRFPYHYDALQNNPNLVQNPGW